MVFGKIVGLADVNQMIKQCLCIGCERRDHAGRRTPLPEGERVFQDAIIQYFGYRNAEFQFLVLAELFQHRDDFVLVFQYFNLESFDLLTVFLRAYFAEERFVAPVFHTAVQGGYVGDGEVYVVRKPGTVQASGLSAFADAGADPFTGVQLSECLVDVMQVVGRVLCRQVFPVTGGRGGFEEITVFHEYHIGIEQLRQLFLITRVQGIRRTISFRDQYGRAVETDVGDDHALRECSGCRVLMVDRLCDAYEIFLGIMVRFQLLDAADSFQPFQFLCNSCALPANATVSINRNATRHGDKVFNVLLMVLIF